MAEQKESSVLFSLKELMSLEEDRIRAEEDEREQRARADEAQRQATERATREAEEARLRAEEEQRRMEELRRREEEARLNAIHNAEMEKARAETDHRTRMEAMAAQQVHEQQLAALHGDKSKKRLQIWIGVITGVLLISGVTGGLLFKRSSDQKEREKQALAAQAQEAKDELDRLKRESEEKEKKVSELKRQFDSAKDEAERAKIEAQLAKAKKESEDARSRLTGGRPAGDGPSKPSKPCNCPPGDPLCSCL
jgi:colicin import membrane protein